MSELAGKRLGKYQLSEYIGRGGMSDVYRAYRIQDNLEVAIKVMRPNPDPEISEEVYVKRFDQEAAIVSNMNHPNILPMYDYGHQGKYHYLVMKLVTGGTLANIMRQRRLTMNEAGGWLYQIASALNHAHQKGIVHRDLKPTNILLDGKGHAYLTDFGIAKLANITGSFTATGNVLGTPTYMAPEQWRSEKLTGVTDVYGLGILVYLMLTSKPPFEADSPHGLMYKHLNDPPPPMRVYVPEITEIIDQVVLKSLAKAPKDRYQSTVDFSDDYQRALRGQETLAQRYPPPKARKSGGADNEEVRIPLAVGAPIQTPPPPPLPAKSNNSPELPPPVYGTPNTYPASLAANAVKAVPPPSISYAPIQEISSPSIQVLNRRRRTKRSGSRTRILLWLLLLMVAGGGSAYTVIDDPFDLDLLPSTSQATALPTSPPLTLTPTSIPGMKPTISVMEITLAGNAYRVDKTITLNATVNQEITIDVAATHTQTVSRIELRRFGYVIESEADEVPQPTLSGRFVYTPRQIGVYVLEVVPIYEDGDMVMGDAWFVTLIVQ